MRWVLSIGLMLVLGLPAFAAQTALEEGRQLVQEYCSGCHAVGAEGSSPHPLAPPFRSLHERFDVDDLAEGLVEGLVSGHPDMPEFEFDPLQAEAIIVYLKSLE